MSALSLEKDPSDASREKREALKAPPGRDFSKPKLPSNATAFSQTFWDVSTACSAAGEMLSGTLGQRDVHFQQENVP